MNKCSLCKKEFETPGEIIAHMEQEHKETLRLFTAAFEFMAANKKESLWRKLRFR